MAKKSGLEYEAYTAEDAKADRDDLKRSGGSYEKIALGKNVYRVLPARKGEKWKRVTYRHFVDIPGAGTVSFTCPRHETKGKRRCKICEQGKKLLNSGEPADEKKARRISAQRKTAINVVNRRNEEAGPRTIEIGIGIERDLIDMRDVEEVDFLDPLKGSDIIIIKSGEGRKNTRYKVKEGDSCRLHESKAVMRDWIENQPDLEANVRVLTDAQIDALLRGEDPRDADDDDPPRKSRRRSIDDDEDEDEAPRRKKSKSIDDDDEDEVDLDVDDDDDEDEEIEI